MDKWMFKIGDLLVALVVALAILVGLAACAPAPAPGQPTPAPTTAPADPQMLLIPRWFLSSVTLDGNTIQAPEQAASLQFEAGGQANGKGGCNGFSTTYETSVDGKIRFGPVMSTKMACEQNMDLETAYFNGLAAVTTFRFEGGNLVLSSADGKTSLVFVKPPK